MKMGPGKVAESGGGAGGCEHKEEGKMRDAGGKKGRGGTKIPSQACQVVACGLPNMSLFE